MTILLANGLAGGKLKTCQDALSASAAAIVPRRVVIALTLLDRPVLDGQLVARALLPSKYFPCGRAKAGNLAIRRLHCLIGVLAKYLLQS